MEITEKFEGFDLVLLLNGHLDKLASPELDKKINEINDNIKTLVLDFSNIEYMSSAGLRVLAKAQDKLESRSGKLIIRNVNHSVRAVFQMTGFCDVLDIQ